MATYYINAYNLIGTFPYETSQTGAPNFKTLLDDLTGIGLMADGDNIIITPSPDVDVDDSANTVNINNRITILGDKSTRVKLPTIGVGMNLNMSGISISNLYIDADTYSQNVLLSVNKNNITISDSIIGGETSNGNASMINIQNGDGTVIQNSTINIPVPTTTDTSYGIYANVSNYCKVTNNVIHMWNNNGKGISFVGASSYNDVSYNIIGKFDSSTSGNVGILFGNAGNYNKIHHNVIGISGPTSQGIVYGIDQFCGKGVEINNNCVYMRENDFETVGLFIPYIQDNTVCSFSIINNIFEFRGLSNDGIAIEASVNKDRSVINYNCLYGFNALSMFINNGAPDVIKKMGSKTIFVDPKTVATEDPLKYPQTDIQRYYCNSNSECIGAGYINHNIGIGVDSDMTFKPNNYVTIIDTVTSNYGIIYGKETTINTFFNSVFTDSAKSFNDGYRVGDGPYPSSAVYRNQFDFKLTVPSQFPFIVGDKFFNTDLTYVCANKIDLRPFDGIACPPNPGYGFPDYKRYEDGLWGYPRIGYKNSCELDGCIIQDTYEDVIVMQDTISSVEVTIYDEINPPCLTE